MMGDPLIIEERADGSLVRLFQECQIFLMQRKSVLHFHTWVEGGVG